MPNIVLIVVVVIQNFIAFANHRHCLIHSELLKRGAVILLLVDMVLGALGAA